MNDDSIIDEDYDDQMNNKRRLRQNELKEEESFNEIFYGGFNENREVLDGKRNCDNIQWVVILMIL